MMGEVKGQITALENQPGMQNSAGIGESKSGPNNTLHSSVATSLDNQGTGAASHHLVLRQTEEAWIESTIDIYGHAQMSVAHDS
jgi:hypothetical protein